MHPLLLPLSASAPAVLPLSASTVHCCRGAVLHHEMGPCWLQVELGPPPAGCPPWCSRSGSAVLQNGLQAALDTQRDADVAAAVAILLSEEQEDQGSGGEGMDASGGEDGLSSTVRWEGWGEAQQASALQQQSNTHYSSTVISGYSQQTASDDGPGCPGRLEQITRLIVRLDRVITQPDTSGITQQPGSVSAVALLEVVASPLQLQSDWQLPWWPRVSTRPGSDAAQALQRIVARAQAPQKGSGEQQQQQQQSPHLQEQDKAALAVSHDPFNIPDAQDTQAAATCPVAAPVAAPVVVEQLPPARADVVFDSLMSMPDSDVQLASRLASMPMDVAPAPPSMLEASASAPPKPHQLPPLTPPALARVGADYLPPAESVGSQPCQEQEAQQQQQQPLLQEQQEQQQQMPAASYSGLLSSIKCVQHASASPRDLYALTALLDSMAFVYVALFYQVVMRSARSLADITDERQLPLDYLTALLVMFGCSVADRLVYSLGSHPGKAALLLAQVAVLLPAAAQLYWGRAAVVGAGLSPRAGDGGTSAAAAAAAAAATAAALGRSPRAHLRAFLLIKCCSWVASAAQLASGYPPRASFDGGGRQRFLFYSVPDMAHLAGFYTFQVRHSSEPTVCLCALVCDDMCCCLFDLCCYFWFNLW
jgi:hypothetical protein